jgi:DNA-binding transcriptional LysR family regulator
MDSFAGMEIFARVVESGSFTAAAASLGTAKSSVSEAVRALEDRLGVRLLDRTTRRVRPTDAGQAFYGRCRRLLDEAAEARAELRAQAKAMAGKLRIATPEGFGARYVVPALAGFLANHPGLDAELAEGTAEVRLVEEGFDLAIRVTRTPGPGLVVRRIASSQVIVVATPAYLAASGVPRRPEDIVRHRLIGFTPLPWRDTWQLGSKRIAVRPRLLTDNTESVRTAALAGAGLAALPIWMVTDALAAGQLTRVLADHPGPTSGIYAVYPGNRLITPAVRAFVEHLVRELRARGMGR